MGECPCVGCMLVIWLAGYKSRAACARHPSVATADRSIIDNDLLPSCGARNKPAAVRPVSQINLMNVPSAACPGPIEKITHVPPGSCRVLVAAASCGAPAKGSHAVETRKYQITK